MRVLKPVTTPHGRKLGSISSHVSKNLACRDIMETWMVTRSRLHEGLEAHRGGATSTRRVVRRSRDHGPSKPASPVTPVQHGVRPLRLVPWSISVGRGQTVAVGTTKSKYRKAGANCCSADTEVRLRSSSPLVTEERRPRWLIIPLEICSR
jgi:hypothetical protein